MGIEQFFKQPVTVLEPATVTDIYNNRIDDWNNPTATTIKGWKDRRTSVEVLDGRDAIVTEEVLFCPPSSPITSRSRLVIGDITYEVNGHPHQAATPRGIHHLEVTLKAVEG